MWARQSLLLDLCLAFTVHAVQPPWKLNATLQKDNCEVLDVLHEIVRYAFHLMPVPCLVVSSIRTSLQEQMAKSDWAKVLVLCGGVCQLLQPMSVESNSSFLAKCKHVICFFQIFLEANDCHDQGPHGETHHGNGYQNSPSNGGFRPAFCRIVFD